VQDYTEVLGAARHILVGGWLAMVYMVSYVGYATHCSRLYMVERLHMGKGGATSLRVGGQCIGRRGVNTVKTLKFEKSQGA